MLHLIKTEFQRKNNYLYWMCSLILLYVLGVGMSSHYIDFLPPVLYLNSLGTGIYLITEIMIILTAIIFTGHHNHEFISLEYQNGYSYTDIFWSKVVTLLNYYICLVLTAFGTSLIAERYLFKNKYFSLHSLHIMTLSVGANFMLVFLLCSVTILLSTLIKSIKNTIVAGLGFQYLGALLAAPIMILLYNHRWLKWNPFNCLFVQFQINKPINHAMTKMSMPESLISTLAYGCIYLFIAYLIFAIYSHNQKKTIKK